MYSYDCTDDLGFDNVVISFRLSTNNSLGLDGEQRNANTLTQVLQRKQLLCVVLYSKFIWFKIIFSKVIKISFISRKFLFSTPISAFESYSFACAYENLNQVNIVRG